MTDTLLKVPIIATCSMPCLFPYLIALIKSPPGSQPGSFPPPVGWSVAIPGWLLIGRLVSRGVTMNQSVFWFLSWLFWVQWQLLPHLPRRRKFAVHFVESNWPAPAARLSIYSNVWLLHLGQNCILNCAVSLLGCKSIGLVRREHVYTRRTILHAPHVPASMVVYLL